MIEPTENDIGRKVIYQGGHPDDREEGVITSFNSTFVFVRYGSNSGSAGTSRRDLEWCNPPARQGQFSDGTGDPLFAPMTLAQLAQWLNERLDNCIRIAAKKEGADADGWYVDARYFRAAVSVVDWASDTGEFPGFLIRDGDR